MIYHFGEFLLDDSARELRRNGQQVETEPKAFDLLHYLLMHRDRAVSKDELLEHIWPNSIVTETALTRCVMKARRAVDDDAGSQAVIRTLHGHGYRFVAQLSDQHKASAVAAAELPDTAVIAEHAEPRVKAPESRRRLWLVAAAAAIGLAALGWYLRPDVAAVAPGTVAILPVVNQSGTKELDWAHLGLMSLMSRMLEDNGVRVAAERPVLSAVDGEALDKPPDHELLATIRQTSGADSVLYTSLDFKNGLHRMEAILTGADGRRTRRIIVGNQPAAIAADLASVLAELMRGVAPPDPDRFSKVSADPFVNELYARALDLELQGELRQAREMFRMASEQEPDLFWLHYEIALCTRDLREWDEAEAQFAALREAATGDSDPRSLIATLNSRGIMYLHKADYESAQRDFSEALSVAAERGKAEDRATVLINLALISTRLGRSEDAGSYYADALAAFDEANLPVSGFLLNNYAGYLMSTGKLVEARTYSERAVDTFRLHGQRRHEAPSLNRLAKILRRQGDLAGALQRHEEALSIYRDLDDVNGKLSVLTAMTALYREKGDLTRARLNADEVLARARENDSPLLIGDSVIQSAYVRLERGDLAGALQEFEDAAKLFADIDDAQGIRGADTGIVLSSIETGDLERAAEMASAMLQAAIADNDPTAEAHARWLGGRVDEAQGMPDAAIAAYGAALAYARDNADTDILIRSATRLANLHLEADNPEQARQLIEELRPLAAHEHAFLRLDARQAVADGDPERAMQILSQLRQSAGEAWNQDDDDLLRLTGAQ